MREEQKEGGEEGRSGGGRRGGGWRALETEGGKVTGSCFLFNKEKLAQIRWQMTSYTLIVYTSLWVMKIFFHFVLLGWLR